MPAVDIILVRWAAGWIDVGYRTPGTRRREGTLNIGNVDSINEAVSAALKVRASLATAAEQVTAGIEPITAQQRPYEGWMPMPNNYFSMPNWNGTPEPQRIAAITITQDDDNGILTYAAETVSPITDQAARLQRWLKRMSNGAIGGQTEQSSPEKPRWQPHTPGRQPTATWTQANADPSTGALQQIVAGAGPEIRAEVRGEVREWYTSLTTAGSTATISTLIINSRTVATATIPAGEKVGTQRLAGIAVTPNADILQAVIVQAGTGATGWTGQARVDAIS